MADGADNGPPPLADGAENAPPRAHRAGIVAILGPPNAGKSSLLNRLLGEKLAIVTHKPQTTRSRILGIHSVPGAQIGFIDTPGRHAGEKTLNQVLNESVEEAASGCDVGLILVDLTRGWQTVHGELAGALRARGAPLVVAGTKADLPGAETAEWPPVEAMDAEACPRISSRSGEGLEALIEALVEQLPESPPLYPEDELTDRPVRWLVAELVREAVFEELEQELPYMMAVEIAEFDESRPELVRIRANLLVLRDSQKRIVVGRGGAMVKRIGSRARRQIESLLDTRVYLELHVKIDPRWLKSPKRIKALGYA